MIKILRLGEERVDSINRFKEIIGSGGYKKELIKSIKNGELKKFFEAWYQRKLVEALESDGSEIEKLNRVCKILIDREGVYREEEESGMRMVNPGERLTDAIRVGGRLELLVGDYRVGEDKVEIRGEVELIGDGRGRSNIVVVRDEFGMYGGRGNKVMMKGLTIRGSGSGEYKIIVDGLECIFEDINFVRVGIKVRNGGRVLVKGCTIEDVGVGIEQVDVDSIIEECDNRYEKVERKVKVKKIEDIVNEDMKEIKLGSDDVVDKEIIINSNIIGNGKKLSVVGAGKIIIGSDDIKIENLEIESDGDRYIIEAEGKKGVEISGCRIKGGIVLKNSEGVINQSEIYDLKLKEKKSGAVLIIGSKIRINKTKIYGNNYNGIEIKDNSEVEIKDSEIFKNGQKDENHPQIWIESSKANIENSKIYDGVKCVGIYSYKSKCSFIDLKVYGNYHNGIVIKGNSEVEIKDSEVFKNGNERVNYPQIQIESSKANIENSKIYDGVKSSGICLIKSVCGFNRLKIYGNYYNGIVINDNSEIEIKGSEIFKNGNEGGNYSQIWVESSKVNIENSKIYEGVKSSGIYLIKSVCVFNRLKIYGNYYNGIVIKDNSEVEIKENEVFNNGDWRVIYSQIFIESSKVNIENSKICDGINNNGIYISDDHCKISLNKTEIKNNNIGVYIYSQITDLRLFNCNIIENIESDISVRSKEMKNKITSMKTENQIGRIKVRG